MVRADKRHENNDAPSSARGAVRRNWSPGTPLEGIIVPLVTPLAGRGELDLAGLDRLLSRVINGGVDAIFLLGTTGEASSLSPDLRRRFVEAAVDLVKQRIPVLVGITDNSLVTTIAQAEHAASLGVDAVVLTTPFYLTPEQDEISAYVCSVVRETTLPMFLYNMPRLTKAWFEPKTVNRLMEIEQVIGIKDSSGDLEYFKSLGKLAKRRSDWSVLVGVEDLLPEALQLGGHGCVGGGAHLWPRLLYSIYTACHRSDTEALESLQVELARMHRIFAKGSYALGSIRALKTGLRLLGVCSELLAEPFAMSTPNERERIRTIMAENGLFTSPESSAASTSSPHRTVP